MAYDFDADFSNSLPDETPQQREARIKREAEIIAKAHADIDAGFGIDEDNFEAWLDALEIDENTAFPQPRFNRS